MFKKKIHIENAVRKLRFNNNEMTQQQLAEDGIRDLVRSRGLGDVYKRQVIAIRPVVILRLNQPNKTKVATIDIPKIALLSCKA